MVKYSLEYQVCFILALYYKLILNGLECFFPFQIRITFPEISATKKRKLDSSDEPETAPKMELLVEPHVIPNRGPYPYNQPKRFVFAKNMVLPHPYFTSDVVPSFS